MSIVSCAAKPTAFTHDTFSTSNRRLEQFLFMYGCRYVEQCQDAYGTNIWIYPNNEEVRILTAKYRQLIADRKMKGDVA